jgi:CRP-like cAMP-binding protein
MNNITNIESLRHNTIDAVAASRYPELSIECKRLLDRALIGRKVDKGEIILNEGDIARSIMFVAKGMVRQFYYKGKRDITEHFSYEGCVLTCIESFFNQEPTRIIVEAIEPSYIFELMYNDIQRLVNESHEFNKFYRKLLEYSLIVSQQKADSWRFETAKSRYINLMNNHPEIIKRAPMSQIASFLLMSPETLSRIRSDI